MLHHWWYELVTFSFSPVLHFFPDRSHDVFLKKDLFLHFYLFLAKSSEELAVKLYSGVL